MLLIIFQMIFPPGLIPFYLTVRQVGLMDSYLAAIIPYAINTFNLIVLVNYFRGLPSEMEEAAIIDGANRWQLMRHVTLPGLATTIMTLLLIQLGFFLSVGFAQLFIMQNNIVLPAGDIIETFIYRIGIQRGRFDYTTAAGLFNSAVGLLLVLVADRIAKRLGLRGTI